MLQLHRFPGQKSQHPLPPHPRRQAPVRPHAERLRPGPAQDNDCRHGELPAERWEYKCPRSAAGDGGDEGDKVAT